MTLKTAAHLIAEAKARIETLSPAAVVAELAGGEVLLVDIREPEERAQQGGIPGAIHTSRGMLEFAADPTSAYYHPAFDPGSPHHPLLRQWRPLRARRRPAATPRLRAHRPSRRRSPGLAGGRSPHRAGTVERKSSLDLDRSGRVS